jgi:monofunctional biosynthetic peptidoglycan transglycosylase
VPRQTLKRKAARGGRIRRLIRIILLGVAAAWFLASLTLIALRWIDPPFTAVHVQRRVQALISGARYVKRYDFAGLESISPNLQHAVVAAEDARFYKHHGFDWVEVRNAVEDEIEDGRSRGASTLTQQLMQTLFFGTGRSFVRKAAEAALVPVAELVLGKRRILELYVNVVEWGPGVYGAEAACQYHYSASARRIGRDQAARLAAILPSPRKRRPDRMRQYSARVLERMAQLGW